MLEMIRELRLGMQLGWKWTGRKVLVTVRCPLQEGASRGQWTSSAVGCYMKQRLNFIVSVNTYHLENKYLYIKKYLYIWCLHLYVTLVHCNNKSIHWSSVAAKHYREKKLPPVYRPENTLRFWSLVGAMLFTFLPPIISWDYRVGLETAVIAT